MSENTNYCQLANVVVSSPSTNNNTNQFFIPTSSEFSIIYNESFTLSSYVPPIVTDVCVGSQNGVRNASTTIKTKENQSTNDNQKYSFILTDRKTFLNNTMTEHSNRTVKSQFYTVDMSNKDDENIYSVTNTENTDNHHDIDALSDTGTYILDDDDDKIEQKKNLLSTTSAFKRYGNKSKDRHGTFDIHGLISATAHTIHRPVVDSNIPKDQLSLSPSSSSNSSIHSLNEDEIISNNKSSPQQQQPQIKPAEAFVISPTVETKSFSTENTSRRKIEVPLKSKLLTKSVSTKDPNFEFSTIQSNTPPHSARSNQNFNFPKQSVPLKTSIRPHTATNEQTSAFQRQSNYQNQRQSSALSTIDHDEPTSNLVKTYPNRSSVLRQQQSTATSKPLSRQPLKSLPSAPSITNNSNSQTNRAVELRRARAQAKIEELAQRTKTHLKKPNPQIDIMSASWHSNASTTNKKDLTNNRTTAKPNVTNKKQDLSATRTISFSTNHRSSSVSPNPPKNRQYDKMSASTYDTEEDRCDLLRNNGQRLAIKLIQLSSGILEKLKPNDDVNVKELEQLVDKLQMVNRTLTLIDASLTGPINDDAFD